MLRKELGRTFLLPKVSGTRSSRFACGTGTSHARGQATGLPSTRGFKFSPRASSSISRPRQVEYFRALPKGTAPLAMRRRSAPPSGFAGQDTGSAGGDGALDRNKPALSGTGRRRRSEEKRSRKAARGCKEESRLPGSDSQPIRHRWSKSRDLPPPASASSPQRRRGREQHIRTHKAGSRRASGNVPTFSFPAGEGSPLRGSRSNPGHGLGTALGVIRATAWTLDPPRRGAGSTGGSSEEPRKRRMPPPGLSQAPGFPGKAGKELKSPELWKSPVPGQQPHEGQPHGPPSSRPHARDVGTGSTVLPRPRDPAVPPGRGGTSRLPAPGLRCTPGFGAPVPRRRRTAGRWHRAGLT